MDELLQALEALKQDVAEWVASQETLSNAMRANVQAQAKVDEGFAALEEVIRRGPTAPGVSPSAAAQEGPEPEELPGQHKVAHDAAQQAAQRRAATQRR